MELHKKFRELIARLAGRYSVAPIKDAYFPSYFKDARTKSSQFISFQLENGGCGVSFVLLPDHSAEDYSIAASVDYKGKDPLRYAEEFGSDDPVKNMIGLAAVNAICQHVMKRIDYPLEPAVDSVGALRLKEGDRVGMVGLFRPLINRIQETGAELLILEKNPALVEQNPQYPLTLDPEALRQCDKVLCTSTVVYNNTLDSILGHCRKDAFISIIGPTAGYFPDPLFDKGVDMVGGTFIEDDDAFMANLRKQVRWRNTAFKFTFRRETYSGLPV